MTEKNKNNGKNYQKFKRPKKTLFSPIDSLFKSGENPHMFQ